MSRHRAAQRGRHAGLSCVLFLALATRHCLLVHAQLTYPIDWPSIPTTSTAKNLTANCICDLTAFVCDTGCCCDPYCPEGVVNDTKAAGRCLPSGPPDQTLDYCVPDSEVLKVNLPANGDFYDMVVQAPDDKFVNKLLCVVSSRNPTIGDFYPDPPVGQNENQGLISCPKASTPAKLNSYEYQTPVYVSRYGLKLPLTVPYPAFSMDCNDQYAVGFMLNLPASTKDLSSTCTRSLYSTALQQSLLPQLCTVNGSLAADRYTQLAFFAGPNDASPYTAVVKEVLFEDPLTGDLATIDSNITTQWSAGASTCYNALRSVDLRVFYTWSETDNTRMGSITSVEVRVVVTNLDASDMAMKQSVRVTFVVPEAASVPNGLQAFSGNPGYQPGFPVLAGQRVDSATNMSTLQPVRTAIARLTEGLALPGPGLDGSCSTSSNTPVRFGQNSTSTCQVPLTAANLRQLCSDQASNPQALVQLLLGSAYDAMVATSHKLMLGVWGNSNYTYPDQWVEVQVSGYPPFNGLIYSSTDNSCSNIIVGYDLQILTGVAFSANNLQSKVLHAVLCWRTATWDFPDDQDPNQPYMFQMSSTVSFISKEQVKQTGVTKPYPPLLVPLPEDIFYPFVTSGAHCPAHGLQIAVQAIMSAVLACLAVLAFAHHR